MIAMISQILAGLIRRGPTRVLKWTVALFYPTFTIVVNGIVQLWKSLVAKENQSILANYERVSAASKKKRLHSWTNSSPSLARS
jgi:hypothetical protein